MRSQTILALFGLASTAVATYSPQALKNFHNLRREHVVVEVRQADSSSSATLSSGDATECLSSAEALLTDAPTPASNLESYFDTFASTADLSNPSALCHVSQNLPQSLSSDYSSFDQAASSWFSKHTSEIQAIATKCAGGDEGAIVSELQAYAANGCTGSLGGTSSGFAARPTGMVAGAMAAAGVLGVAVAL